jgi:hypothetical protein
VSQRANWVIFGYFCSSAWDGAFGQIALARAVVISASPPAGGRVCSVRKPTRAKTGRRHRPVYFLDGPPKENVAAIDIFPGDLLEMVVCRALPTAHATSGVLFRAIEWQSREVSKCARSARVGAAAERGVIDLFSLSSIATISPLSANDQLAMPRFAQPRLDQQEDFRTNVISGGRMDAVCVMVPKLAKS